MNIKSRIGYLWNQKFISEMNHAISNFSDASDLIDCYTNLLPQLIDLDVDGSINLLRVSLNFLNNPLNRKFIEYSLKKKIFYFEKYIELYIRLQDYPKAIKHLNFLIEDIYKSRNNQSPTESKLLSNNQLFSAYMNRSYAHLKITEHESSRLDFEESEIFSNNIDEIDVNYQTVDLFLRKSEIQEQIFNRLDDSIETLDHILGNWRHPNLSVRHKIRKKKGDFFLKQMKYEDMIDQYTYEYRRISDDNQKTSSLTRNKMTKDLDTLFRSFYNNNNNNSDEDEKEDEYPGLSFEEEYICCKKILDVLILKNHLDDNNNNNHMTNFSLSEWYGYRGMINYQLKEYSESMKDFEEESRIGRKEEEEEWKEDPTSIYTRFKACLKTNMISKAKRDGILFLSIVEIESEENEKQVRKVCGKLSSLVYGDDHRLSFLFDRFGDVGLKRLYVDVSSGLLGGYEVTNTMRIGQPTEEEKDFMAAYYCKYVLQPSLNQQLSSIDSFLKKFILKKFLFGTWAFPNQFEKFVEKEYIYSLNNDNDDDNDEVINEQISLVIENLNPMKNNCVIINWVDEDNNNNHESFNFKIPIYFLSPSYFTNKINNNIDEPINIFFGKTPKVSEHLILKCLYGYRLKEENESNEVSDLLIPLYLIFKNLEMFEHLHILLYSTIQKLSLKNTIREFTKCIILFEDKTTNNNNNNNNNSSNSQTGSSQYDDTMEKIDNILMSTISDLNNIESSEKKYIDFKSSLSLALFRNLRGRIREIETKINYVQALEKIEYYSKLKSEVKFPTHLLSDHSDLKGTNYAGSKDYSSVFEVILKRLHQNRSQFGSLQLRTKDMGEFGESLIVHKEILIIRSNFFFRMFKFSGLEASSNVVDVEILSKPALEILIENIYLSRKGLIYNQGKEINLKSLLELLHHSEIYDDFYLELQILKRIDKVMRDASEKDEIVVKVLEIGFMLRQFSTNIRYLMTKRWANLSKLPFHVVEYLIETSIKTNNLATMESENSENIMKVKVEGLMKRVRDCNCSTSSRKRVKSGDGSE